MDQWLEMRVHVMWFVHVSVAANKAQSNLGPITYSYLIGLRQVLQRGA